MASSAGRSCNSSMKETIQLVVASGIAMLLHEDQDSHVISDTGFPCCLTKTKFESNEIRLSKKNWIGFDVQPFKRFEGNEQLFSISPHA